MAEKQLEGLAERWEARFPGIDAATVEPIARLGAVSRAIAHFHGDVLRPHGLQLSDYQVLSILLTGAPGDEPSPKRLSEVLRQTPAGMTKTLDRLETLRAIRRVSSPADRRSVLIELTARGKRLAEQACLAELDAQQELLGGFTKKELATLNGLLQRLLGALTRE